MDFDSSQLGPAAAFMASVTWAVGVLGYSKLSMHYPAYIVNFHRIMVGLPAAMIMLTIAGGWGESMAALDAPKFLWAIVVVLSSYAFGDALFFMSTKRIGGPASLAVASIYPLWSALWGAVVDGDFLSRLQIFGVFITITGVVAVILSGAKEEDLAPGIPRLQEITTKPFYKRVFRGPKVPGLILALFASLCWAMNTIAVSRLGTGLDPMMVNVLRLGIALMLCPLIGVGMNGKKSFKLIPAKIFLPFFPIFLIECVFGPFFYVYGLSHSSLAVGAALTALAPAISVPIAVLMGREPFSWLKSSGVFAVVVGIWLLLGIKAF